MCNEEDSEAYIRKNKKNIRNELAGSSETSENARLRMINEANPERKIPEKYQLLVIHLRQDRKRKDLTWSNSQEDHLQK